MPRIRNHQGPVILKLFSDHYHIQITKKRQENRRFLSTFDFHVQMHPHINSQTCTNIQFKSRRLHGLSSPQVLQLQTQNHFKTKRRRKIGLKTCKAIPLFSFPQIALSTADISDAIQNSQLNCNFSRIEQPKTRLCIVRMAVEIM